MGKNIEGCDDIGGFRGDWIVFDSVFNDVFLSVLLLIDVLLFLSFGFLITLIEVETDGDFVRFVDDDVNEVGLLIFDRVEGEFDTSGAFDVTFLLKGFKNLLFLPAEVILASFIDF